MSQKIADTNYIESQKNSQIMVPVTYVNCHALLKEKTDVESGFRTFTKLTTPPPYSESATCCTLDYGLIPNPLRLQETMGRVYGIETSHLHHI